ncbi:hypothetical protein [Thiothrix subterranea]|uniref:hypothetical protein n=1 Tax=Thiothrix subterranea TaxID=2735563 RepID=UPI00280B8020|nr:hypothetical protein [Thiothrix subterranea]
MKPFTRILRLWTINRVFIRHGLDELVFRIPFMRPVAFIYHMLPWNWGKQETRPRGERIRRALEDLGRFSSNSGKCSPPAVIYCPMTSPPN